MNIYLPLAIWFLLRKTSVSGGRSWLSHGTPQRLRRRWTVDAAPSIPRDDPRSGVTQTIPI